VKYKSLIILLYFGYTQKTKYRNLVIFTLFTQPLSKKETKRRKRELSFFSYVWQSCREMDVMQEIG
jgi:hypothetical protein